MPGRGTGLHTARFGKAVDFILRRRHATTTQLRLTGVQFWGDGVSDPAQTRERHG